MTQIFGQTSGGGGSGIEAIDGDVGSVVGSTINIITGVSTQNSGSSIEFTGVGNTLTLNVTDANLNTIIGNTAGNLTMSGEANTGLGKNVLQANTTGGQNCGLGAGVLAENQTGNANLAAGQVALTNNISGNINVSLGAFSMVDNVSGSGNIAIGPALGLLLSGDDNICIGQGAGGGYTSNESNNIIVGPTSGTAGESGVMRLGDFVNTTDVFVAGVAGKTVSNLNVVTIDTTTGEMGSETVALGGIGTIDGDTGSATGATITFTADNSAGATPTFTATGSTVTLNLSGPNANTYLGTGAGGTLGASTAGCGVGVRVLESQTSGGGNVGLGNFCGQAVSSGFANTFLGNEVNRLGNPSASIFIGASCGTLSSGVNNLIAGNSSATSIGVGSNNVILGGSSGNNYDANESGNIIIGAHVDGEPGENDTIRIGDTDSQRCFIGGIVGATASPDQFVMINSSTNQLATGSGAATTWTPRFIFSGGDNVSYFFQSGVYYQFGKLVFITLTISVSSFGASSGDVSLNLPVPGIKTAINTLHAYSSYINLSSGFTQLFTFGNVSGGLDLYQAGGPGGIIFFNASNFAPITGGQVSHFYIAGHYFIN